MTVRAGRELLAIPGPTNVPDAVLQAMQHPAVDIYSGNMLGVTHSLLADLKKVFRTSGDTYIYASNGHGGWESSLSNVLSRGDKVLVLESGRFAIGWGENARGLGADVEVLKGDWSRAVDPAAVAARLAADTARAIKAVLVVQIDTASAVVNDIAAISKAMKSTGHPALLMVDAVASLGCMPFEMDAWGVDVAMTGSQKGLMTPPGLAMVAANARAKEIHKTATCRTPYWDWTFRDGPEHYMKYAGTPPEHLLFGLRKALDLLFAEGMESAFRRHELLAGAVRRAVAVWAEGGVLSFNISDERQRANSVTTVLWNSAGRTNVGVQAMIDYAREKCGVVLGVGIGGLGDKAFRIAHMGHTNAAMVLGTLAVVETSLSALSVPHGKGGVQAAVGYLAANVKP
jgi:alanine-glyoxylate transaminase/serine-glyoxylate transaminase/serine-pyruvate transaminase